jgi:hypothetical protein
MKKVGEGSAAPSRWAAVFGGAVGLAVALLAISALRLQSYLLFHSFAELSA